MNKKQHSSTILGFTLVELLLVVTLVSVFFATIAGLINPAKQLNRGNDGQRKADLLKIQSGLEQYYADNGDYPGPVGWCGQISSVSKPEVRTALEGYLQKIPKDPKYADSTKDYYYWHKDLRQYKLYSVLDESSDPLIVSNVQSADGVPAGCTGVNIAYNFSNDPDSPIGPTSTISPTATITPVPVEITSFQSVSASIPSGTSTTLNWTVTGSLSYCASSGGDASWSSANRTGTSYVTQSLASSKTYTLTCYDTGGGSSQRQTTVEVYTLTACLTGNPPSAPSTVLSTTALNWRNTKIDSIGTNMTVKEVAVFGVTGGSGLGASYEVRQSDANGVLTGALLSPVGSVLSSAPDASGYYYSPALSIPMTTGAYYVIRYNQKGGTSYYNQSISVDAGNFTCSRWSNSTSSAASIGTFGVRIKYTIP